MRKDKEILEALRTRLALPLIDVGRALHAGRRRIKKAVEAGEIPITPCGSVPTAWLKRTLQIDQEDGPRAA